MPDTSIIGNLIIYIVVLLLAISAHEAAHAWMSYRFGDDTAYLLGRVTLNPRAHIDPLGTLLIPIAGFILAAIGGPIAAIPLIGWGKPTPVNPLRWRNKDTANVMVSAAGVMANTFIALSALIIIKVLQASNLLSSGAVLGQTGSLIMGTMPENIAEPVALLLYMTLVMNTSLAVFNLLPLPPLDGSKILETFLPASMQPVLAMLERYGYLVLMAAIYFGLFRLVFSPFNKLIVYLLLI